MSRRRILRVVITRVGSDKKCGAIQQKQCRDVARYVSTFN
jgi:hypothetical protein